VITFSRLGLHGRFGNQLFQYSVVKSVALETGYSLKIPNPENYNWQNQKSYLKCYDLKADLLEPEDLQKIRYRFVEPDHTKFYADVFKVPDDIDFYGYFQNYRYFSKHLPELKKEFVMREEITDKANDYLDSIRECGDRDSEIVSIHVRRGDWLAEYSYDTNMSHHYGVGDVLTPDSPYGRYVYPAMRQFEDKKVKFLVFSGGSQKGVNHNQTDMDWCKRNFKGDEFYFCEGNEDIVDFEIMRMCNHNILCHMTSFGYWAALLNGNQDKRVVAPQNYTFPDDGRQHQGFYPPSWVTV